MQTHLTKAKEGDIKAFAELFSEFQARLKSYLYRLLVNRDDVEDIAHDTFVRAFDKINTFNEKSSLKSWVFSIATNLAYDQLRDKSRWSINVMEKAKEYAHSDDNNLIYMKRTSQHSPFDIREHIDFCFTCMSKVLPLDQQVVVILKDIYKFKVKDIALIMDKTAPAVKHILRFGRQTMIEIFESRCSLINKKGVCYQCSELNDYLNPKQKRQEFFIREQLVSNEKENKKQKLFELRKALIKGIDPLNIEGAELHDIFMKFNRRVEGEIS